MKIIVYKNGTYKNVEDNSAWEYQNDPDLLITIPGESLTPSASIPVRGENEQQWPPHVWRLKNPEGTQLYNKWCYCYNDEEGLNQHQYPFDSEQAAIDHYVKRFGKPLPASDIVERMREMNPYKDKDLDPSDQWYYEEIGFNKAVTTLKQLLGERGEKEETV